MAANASLLDAVTRAVQGADTVPDLRERTCDAVVDAGHDFACFRTTNDEYVTASRPGVEAPDPDAVTPTFRATANSPAPPGADATPPGPDGLGDDAAAKRVDGPAATLVEGDDYAATVPVADADEYYGTLAFGPVDDTTDDAERDRLDVLGTVVGQAITRLTATRERDRLRAAHRTERRQFEKLHSVAAAMVSCEDATSIYHLAIDGAENILEFDICGIDVVEDGYLVPKATSAGMEPEDSQRLPADSGIAGKTFQENASIVVDDVSTHDDAEPANPEYSSVLSVPIEDVGVFQAGSREVGAFSRDDAELVELLMAHVSATFQRLRSASALRESEEKYRTLIEQSHDAVTIFAAESLAFVNERAAELFGRSREALLDADACELFHPEDRAKLERVAGELTAEAGRRQTFEGRIQRPDGDVRFCEFSATSIGYEDDVAVLASIRDITERKARERDLERQNERLEEFASVVSHDLRSPINVARGSVDLAADTGDLSHLDRATDALDRMEALVEDVLQLARQGRLVDETESVAVEDVATAAWECVDAPAATLTVAADGSVDADRTRLQELFENLFRNAVEHGGDDVAVRVERTDDGIAVEDDGEGLPANEQDVFERGVTSSEDGTGFGLAIVESIAEAHGWTVDAAAPASPDADRGARFEITGCRPG